MNSDAMAIDTLKREASNWFAALRDRLCIAFEEIENEAQGPFFDEARTPGRFERSPWTRRDTHGEAGGGGVMAMMRGRVFEKVGVHVSVIHGALPPDFAGQMAEAEDHPQLWAAGISLIAHPWHPHAPTAHMNLRLVATARAWFGGGGDLTPMLATRRNVDDPDSIRFHAAMRAACAANGPAGAYERYRAGCDEYFHLAHRNESRGIGGIFFDRLWSGFPDRDFAFVKDVGEAFLGVYPAIIRDNIGRSWTEGERFEQETLRGRYVEFNLLQDRGTLFGLRTGGNIESILSSLPPRVRWP